MQTKTIFTFTLLPILLSAANCIQAYYQQEASPTSFILFTLHNNHITLERYSLDEIKPGTVKLPATIREGHTLFKLGLSEATLSASSLFFYPTDQRYLVILATQKEKQADLLLSWAPLITHHIKGMGTIDTVHFSIDHLEGQEPWTIILTTELKTEKEHWTLELLLDHPVQAACGVFIADSYFNYDKGLFTRTFTKKQLDELNFLTTFDDTPVTKGTQELLQHLLAQALYGVSHYASACLSAIKAGSCKSIAYILAKWNAIKNYFAQRNAEKKANEALQKSFDAEDKFDKLLEEAMNSELDFIPKEKPKEPSAFFMRFQKIGMYLLMRYIALEQTIRDSWHRIRGTENQLPNQQSISEKLLHRSTNL